MRYCKIRKMDISNGPGIRVSIFTQGCEQHCKGCFNPETWRLDAGEEVTDKVVNKLIDLCNKPEIKGISILGGEPLLECNISSLIHITTLFRAIFPDKDIWIWTGFEFQDVLRQLSQLEFDYAVTGPYIEELRDPTLKYRGSSNQRIIYRSSDSIEDVTEQFK